MAITKREKIFEVLMRKVKKITNIIVTLFMFFIPPIFLTGSELGNKNLKGIQFVIIATEFNGVLFEEGYVDRDEEEIKAFNLEKAVAKLKKDDIPIIEKNIREIYSLMGSMIQKTGLQILKVKKYSKEGTTIIPTLTLKVDTMTGAKNLYFTVVHLTLSKLVSNWSGTKRIYAPVYTWSEKKMAASESKGLMKTIKTAVSELTNEFISELNQANIGRKTKK
jgi:hypothetical protein